MAKKRAAKPPTATTVPPTPDADSPTIEVIDPQRVHELFGLPGPYEPPKPPPSVPGYHTLWDPGVSVLTARLKFPKLFCHTDWLDKEPFAKASDQWRWRQVRVVPVGVGETFADQEKKLSRGDEVASAREVVVSLVLHALATEERFDIPRLRCRDVLPSGRRVVVGPFHPLGLELANVADHWQSPGIGLAAVFTPRKK